MQQYEEAAVAALVHGMCGCGAARETQAELLHVVETAAGGELESRGVTAGPGSAQPRQS